MATIICRCGTVEIEFHSPHDLFRLECCCHDCSAALWYANQCGGPACPFDRMVDSSWFPNDFSIVKGEDEIGAFLNFINADTTRFYCRACWTVLFGDHPLYAGRVLVTQTGTFDTFEALKNADRMPAQARHFLKDLSHEQRAALPHWAGDASNVYEGVADVLMERFSAMLEAGSTGKNMNAEILLSRLGAAIVPEGAPRLSGGPPTMVQQMAQTGGDPV